MYNTGFFYIRCSPQTARSRSVAFHDIMQERKYIEFVSRVYHPLSSSPVYKNLATATLYLINKSFPNEITKPVPVIGSHFTR